MQLKAQILIVLLLTLILKVMPAMPYKLPSGHGCSSLTGNYLNQYDPSLIGDEQMINQDVIQLIKNLAGVKDKSTPIESQAKTILPRGSILNDLSAPYSAEQVEAVNTASESDQQKAQELRKLVQHLYVAQARVQLEATEIRKAQVVATNTQQKFEEATNQVHSIMAALQNAQQENAAAAIRAQLARLQLAAHDQLLFAARQDVDALSSQMVGLQATEGISDPKMPVDLRLLLRQLKSPILEAQKQSALTSNVAIMPPTPFSREVKA